jgi:hypothetical protein
MAPPGAGFFRIYAGCRAKQLSDITGKPIVRWGRKVMGLRTSVQIARLPKHKHFWQFLIFTAG